MLIAIAVATALIWAARDELALAIHSFSLAFLVMTYAATLTLNLVLWIVFHASAGGGSEYSLTSRMFFGGQVAKYIPGKVWGVVFQATLKSTSIPVGNIIQANIVVYVLTVLSTVFAGLMLLVYPISGLLTIVLFVAGATLSSYFIFSDRLYLLLQRVSRFSKRFELASAVPGVEFSLFIQGLVFVVVTSLYVVSNVFLVYVFYDFALSEILNLVAYLSIAWLAGAVVAVTPAGLGVREIVFVTIGTVGDPANFELFASIAIVARVIQVGQDLLSAFLAPLIVRLVEIKKMT